MKNESIPNEMEKLFLALADKTRLRLLNLMGGGEICVNFLVEILGESQPKISRHLAYLRGAGIVEARRDGKWMNYKVSEPKDEFAAQILRDTHKWLDSQEKMRSEYEKMTQICCLPEFQIKISSSKEEIYASPNINSNRKSELEIFLL